MHDFNWDDLPFFPGGERTRLGFRCRNIFECEPFDLLRRLAGLEKRLGVRLFDRLPQGYRITAQGEELRNQLRLVKRTNRDHRKELGRPRSNAFWCHPRDHHRYFDRSIADAFSGRVQDFASRHKPRDHRQQSFFQFDPARGRRCRTPVQSSSGKISRSPYRTSSERGLRLKELSQEAWEKTDWAAHHWVAPEEALVHLAQARWMRANVPEDRVVVRVDSLLTMVDAVPCGLGAGMLLCLLADSQRDLVRLANPIDELDTDVWILTHPALKRVARIQAFTDFLFNRLRASANLYHGNS